jgi:hypothetical protein
VTRSTLLLLLLLLLPQGFLAADRKTALQHFNKAEDYFKHCKEKVRPPGSLQESCQSHRQHSIGHSSASQQCSMSSLPLQALQGEGAASRQLARAQSCAC